MTYKRRPEAARRKRQRQNQRLRPRIEALYDELFQRFPQTFFRAPQQIHPLKIGIFQELCDQFSTPRRMLHRVIWRYTHQRAYLQALAEGKPRLDLSGQAVETLSDAQWAQARARLNLKPTRRKPARLTQAAHPGHETLPPEVPAQATLTTRQAQDASEVAPAASASKTTPMNGCQSITQQTITCLECGQAFKQLSSRHLGRHGLDLHSYRTKHGIPSSEPLAARATTERRRQVVRETRPWEKASMDRKGQGGKGHSSPEPNAEAIRSRQQRNTSTKKASGQTESAG
jgi:sRNA-binding protein